MSLRVALAMFSAPLIVPAYIWSVSGVSGRVVHVLLLGVVAQALAFVSGYIVALLGLKLSALKATAVGAAVGATVPIGLALAWQASEMLDGIPVLTVLGAAVGFVYWVIAWWEPARP